MKDIIKEGHPNLKAVSKDTKLPLCNSDKKLMKKMLNFIKNSVDPKKSEQYGLRPSVGIAAPQLNIKKRIFAMHMTDLDGVLYEFVFVNPIITQKSETLVYLPGGEGCLSVDRETTGITPRNEWVQIAGYLYEVNLERLIPINLRLEGYSSIVFQHEYDHLEGILFSDKLFLELPNAKPLFSLEEN